MQRVRFESMVKSLLPAVTDRAVDTWVQYAQELDHEEAEAVENGCDPTAEEFEESQSALRAFKLSEQESTEIQMM